MENIIGRIISLMSEEIDKNKENKSNESLEYRLGKNDAYSAIHERLMDDKNNNSEWEQEA